MLVDVGEWEPFLAREARTIATIFRLADSFVDFAGFGSDSDGVVGKRRARRARGARTDAGRVRLRGAERAFVGALDGKHVTLQLALNGINTNLATHVHELGHIIVHMPNYYGYGMSHCGIDGPTIEDLDDDGRPKERHRLGSAYTDIHLGWRAHRVVDRDGWVTVHPRVGGDVVVVYDPALGTEDS